MRFTVESVDRLAVRTLFVDLPNEDDESAEAT